MPVPARPRSFWRILSYAAAGILIAVGVAAGLAERADQAASELARARCMPLRIVDRFGQILRELPGQCAPYGQTRWTALAQVPPLVTQMLVESEDRRFELHPGIDPVAIARAAWANVRAGRIVSGASTLTMQLARMLEPRADAQSKAAPWRRKITRAWTALALELPFSKREILEAYLNLAYYGAGAYGIEAAAQTYFGRSVESLSEAQASVLAVLPHAPGAYDLRRGFEGALHRRDSVLTSLRRRGLLDARAVTAIQRTAVALAPPPSAAPTRAGHFVDYVLAALPPNARAAGGELHTTLDLGLQMTLERIVVEHVASLSDRGVDQAGVVVLDSATSSIRAMVGSRSYAVSQLNITTRRRQLGSLLKPFVYALAIEAGENPASVALDVGDIASEYQARDWVGREAGPLSYREALAGSYNLAAVHVLERVGVPALHARLRRAGVAALEAAPARYGLPLALGSARVRLLDVASGYGFLVRGGLTRCAHAIESLERGDGSHWQPAPSADRTLFSDSVSWHVMDILSDASARHRRFGSGLPLDAEAPVAAKTGTASGLSDLSAIMATREFIVAAWAGRFDGQPTHGTSGMWAAAPLARRALVAALGGRPATLPPRPEAAVLAASTPSTSVRANHLPAELEPWAERARARATSDSH